MIVFFLKDSKDGRIDGIIISQASTKQDIIQVIQKTKENPDYTLSDLLKVLTKVCSLHLKKDIAIDTIYYQ